MKISRLAILLCALVSLALAGCGGGDDEVPTDAVAVVDGEEIAKTDYDALIAQAKKSYKNQKRDFPKAGSQEFQTLKNQAVQFLVQREQFEQEAENLDVDVTDKQVDARLAQIQKQYFGGDKKKYEKQLKEQGLTDEQVRNDIRAQIVSERIFAKVTKDVKVTDKQIEDYYNKNKAQYSQPESRDVRHILVEDEGAGGRALRAAQGGARLRSAGEEVLRGHGLEGERRQADDLEGPDRGAVRQDGVRAEEERDLEAGEDRVRLPHHPAAQRRQGCEGHAAEGRQGVDQPAAGSDEEERGDDEVGRRAEEGLQGQDLLRSRLQSAAGRHRHHLHQRERVAGLPLAEALVELQELTRRLRRDCPWDREQTALTIVPHTVEEAYEVADAAAGGEPAKLLDELGDLLFQVYFLALLLEEEGRRRPRGGRARRARQARRGATRTSSARPRPRPPAGFASRWEEIKSEQEGREGIFHDVPASLPALLQARKLQRRAVGRRLRLAGPRRAAREGARGARRARGGGRARGRAESRDRAGCGRRARGRRPALHGGQPCAPPERRSRAGAPGDEHPLRRRASSAPRSSRTPRGERWSELPLEEQDRYYDQAKEQLG